MDRSVCLSAVRGGRSTEEIRKFWQNYEHPSINKQEWSEQEVTQLKAVAAKHGHLDWQSIAEGWGWSYSRGLPLQLPGGLLGPLGRAAGDLLRATREGSWRRSEVAQTAPPPQMHSRAASVFCPLRPSSLTSCSGRALLIRKTLYLVPLGLVLSRLLRQGLSSHSHLCL